jgi:hypothetical protein
MRSRCQRPASWRARCQRKEQSGSPAPSHPHDGSSPCSAFPGTQRAVIERRSRISLPRTH